MDIAYLTRPGENQGPLRYSLRSLVNVTNFNPNQDTVWLIGHLPSWAVNVRHIPGNRWRSKGRNIFGNWRLFCAITDGPHTFAAFNDDVYATGPATIRADEWHELITDTLAQPRTRGWWQCSLHATLTHCQTYCPEPRSFELHRPVIIDRDKLRTALDEVAADGEPPQWRSTYGNRWNTGRIQVPDVKARTATEQLTSEPWASTDPTSWAGSAGIAIRAMYPEPSRYER